MNTNITDSYENEWDVATNKENEWLKQVTGISVRPQPAVETRPKPKEHFKSIRQRRGVSNGK